MDAGCETTSRLVQPVDVPLMFLSVSSLVSTSSLSSLSCTNRRKRLAARKENPLEPTESLSNCRTATRRRIRNLGRLAKPKGFKWTLASRNDRFLMIADKRKAIERVVWCVSLFFHQAPKRGLGGGYHTRQSPNQSAHHIAFDTVYVRVYMLCS